MWERFGFYVVQGLLVLYMTEAFGFSDEKSFSISGTFMAFSYMAPILGGFLADRLLGFKTAIYYGGVFLCLGYAILALPWRECFYLGLATVILGTGLFKPTVSTLLGSLYRPEDPTRDTGFTLFYIGINLGALFAGFSSGFIKQDFGWRAPFVFASLGLILGLLFFRLGAPWMPKSDARLPLQKYTFLRRPYFLSYCFLAILLLDVVLKNELLVRWLLPLVGVALLIFLLGLTLKQAPAERARLLLLNILIISSVVFWTLFLQLFMSTTLFIERNVDRECLGLQWPTTVFYSLESIFVILLGPFFAWTWQALNHNDKNPSLLLKFALAMVFAGLCFLLLASGTLFANQAHMVSPLWIVGAYLLLTVGELLLSPIGLAAVTTHAPPHLVGMMMGIWFVATGFGGSFAAGLARLSAVPQAASPEQVLHIYRETFLHYGFIAFVVAIILWLIQLSLKDRLGKGS
jgi:POT family proton-dependent oligopeptide transporter